MSDCTRTTYRVDSTGKLGEVVAEDPAGTVWLRPPGGGAEWSVQPDDLRVPTADELKTARLLSTPVGGVR
ncbi:hypothetical protein ACH4SP_14220 [Streptomyces sp. NPDC021093]|uniref:hypothetical protein n=1 Tax=Streptomyces sp. NPDC021093 TaxID=3365112 RepID=UPI00379540C9